MPDGQPEMGEVWRQIGTSTEALVGHVHQADGTVYLISRNGRQIPMPLRTILNMWEFLFRGEQGHHPCHREGSDPCSGEAVIQMANTGLWTCIKHKPSGPIRFQTLSADIVDAADTLSLAVCPACHQMMIGAKSQTHDEFTITTCPNCESQFSILVGEGRVGEGMALAERAMQVADALNQEFEITARCGVRIKEAVDRLGGGNNTTNIGDIPLRLDPSLGVLNILIVGRSKAAMGRGDGPVVAVAEVDPMVMSTKESVRQYAENHNLDLPILGTHRILSYEGIRGCVVVKNVEIHPDRGVVVRLDPTVSLRNQLGFTNLPLKFFTPEQYREYTSDLPTEIPCSVGDEYRPKNASEILGAGDNVLCVVDSIYEEHASVGLRVYDTGFLFTVLFDELDQKLDRVDRRPWFERLDD